MKQWAMVKSNPLVGCVVGALCWITSLLSSIRRFLPWVLILLVLMLFLVACESSREPATDIRIDKLFTLLPAAYTGITFENNVEYTEEFNVYTYRNFYNGGGVGLGDINNDGLLDIYFCGNQQPNKLYLNKGNQRTAQFQFEDITEKAGVNSEGVWSTGVSFADVNGDGWLDIYVCKSGDMKGKKRHNELFINNGNGPDGYPTFTEMASAYGLAEKGLSTHAAFFDYDRDGDLDCYLLNNSFRSVGNYDLVKDQRKIRDPLGGNKLYRNDAPTNSPLSKAGQRRSDVSGVFTDVSEQAGIYGSTIGFGLGVTIGDVNRDGWQDIYVSNDFFERDYLYLNKQDGTFEESLEKYLREISMGSMGADMADINNDGYPEIFVTEMLPEDNARLKTKSFFETWNKYQMDVKNGYYHQFPRNVLQLNNGLAPLKPGGERGVYFSEIGRMAGVCATDWSWGALMADFDNDGYKDIFVANGIFKDLTDLDYIQFMADPATVREILKRDNAVIKKLVDMMPSQKLPNYLFHNNGNLTFANVAAQWGLATPSFSNGSAYGDIDNDGDLDLVVSNVNMPPFVYRNETDTLLKGNRYLKINLKGTAKNTFALGTQVTIAHHGVKFYQEHVPMRGFESSVGYGLLFGLGNLAKVDSVIIQWPNGETSLLKDIPTNQVLTLDQNKMAKVVLNSNLPAYPPVFKEVSGTVGIEYVHQENEFSDFDREVLIYQMLSAEGPKLCKGDVNGDGLEDFYIGGAKDSPGTLFVQTANGPFKRTNEAVFEQDKVSEDTDCLFFDADNDRDLDLYVTSGGNEFPSSSTALIDRLYFNDGKGNFKKSTQLLPAGGFESASCVKAADFDGDGDQDLFVGIRLLPFEYGLPVNGYLLENDGKAHFKNITNEIAPELIQVGMIKDAQWTDYDNDHDQDLLVVGEWMGIKLFRNDPDPSDKRKRRLTDVSQSAGLENTNGFWNCLQPGDFDHDGDIDFVVGNQGLNTRFKASVSKPMSMYVYDFDHNGTTEQIISAYNGEKSYPLAVRQDLTSQIPSLKKKYLRNADYKEQTVTDIFTPAQLHRALKLDVYECRSSLLINQGDGTFRLKPLPTEAQFSPVCGVLVNDFNKDGYEDIVLGGNFYRSKPEMGIHDASYGLLLTGNGKGEFRAVPAIESGFFSKGEIRDIITIKRGSHQLLIVGKNNDSIQVFQY